MDNVEQVLIDVPTAGTYTLHVGHTGTSFTQDYTLLVSGGLDESPPTVVRFTPADDTTGVSVVANLAIDFSERVQKGATGNITIKKSSDNSTVETIPVTGDRVTIAGNVATIDPAADLLASTDYYVLADSGAFEDLAGNDWAGISDAAAWNFTTGSGGGGTFTNATAITISPSDGAVSPYPSEIVVSGLSGSIVDVNVTLHGFTHTYPDDVDILLVSPSGQNLLVLSDVGGSTAVTGLNLALDDAAADPLPD